MITIEKVIEKINELEKRNDQSIIFTINQDESGSFEDFWNSTQVVSFNSLKELEKILNNAQTESRSVSDNEPKKEACCWCGKDTKKDSKKICKRCLDDLANMPI